MRKRPVLSLTWSSVIASLQGRDKFTRKSKVSRAALSSCKLMAYRHVKYCENTAFLDLNAGVLVDRKATENDNIDEAPPRTTMMAMTTITMKTIVDTGRRHTTARVTKTLMTVRMRMMMPIGAGAGGGAGARAGGDGGGGGGTSTSPCATAGLGSSFITMRCTMSVTGNPSRSPPAKNNDP